MKLEASNIASNNIKMLSQLYFFSDLYIFVKMMLSAKLNYIPEIERCDINNIFFDKKITKILTGNIKVLDFEAFFE